MHLVNMRRTQPSNNSEGHIMHDPPQKFLGRLIIVCARHQLDTGTCWGLSTQALARTFLALTIISPVVTRFFCPPEMPRTMASPTGVSAHMSSPSIRTTYSVATLCFAPCASHVTD